MLENIRKLSGARRQEDQLDTLVVVEARQQIFDAFQVKQTCCFWVQANAIRSHLISMLWVARVRFNKKLKQTLGETRILGRALGNQKNDF